MFNIGAGEMVFILVAALLVLGPQRLPELARAIGKFVREFRRQTDEVRNVVEREFYSMDQDFQREQPPARPGPRFGAPKDEIRPDATTNQVATPVNPAAFSEPVAPPVDPTAPAAPAAAPEPLGLDPAHAPEPLPVERVPAAPEPLPIPGTVARNAPKRS